MGLGIICSLLALQARLLLVVYGRVLLFLYFAVVRVGRRRVRWTVYATIPRDGHYCGTASVVVGCTPFVALVYGYWSWCSTCARLHCVRWLHMLIHEGSFRNAGRHLARVLHVLLAAKGCDFASWLASPFSFSCWAMRKRSGNPT